MPVTLVWRSDVHLSETPPQSRKDNWQETVLAKLEQVGRIATQVQANAVLDGGDLFHVKTPSRNTHATNSRLAAIHKSYPCPTYTNIGNHDVKYGDYKYLGESPLDVLFQGGVFHRLYDEHEARIGDVRVVGIPYHGTTYDLDRFRRIAKGSEKYLVVTAHLLASPTGGSMYEREDVLKYNDLLTLCPDVDVFCFGHWHQDQGVTEIAPQKFVVNLGSLSRGSLSEDEIKREPKVAVMTFGETISIRTVSLDVAPASEVFDLEGHTRMEERKNSMETFVESFKQALLPKAESSLIDRVNALGLPDTIREKVIFYLEKT